MAGPYCVGSTDVTIRVSQGALHVGAELLKVRLVATRPSGVLGPRNL
jgi:hypothetical protein